MSSSDTSIPATAASYDDRVKTAAGAVEYAHRKPRKDRAERELLRRALSHLPAGLEVLDVPCGAGRMLVLLAGLGHRPSGADLSPEILRIAGDAVRAAGLPACPLSLQNARKLACGDGAFDAVLCFRLFHHYPTDVLRRQQVAELCRVARRYVVMSYFTPWSFTSLKRCVRARLGRRELQNSTPRKVVRAMFAEHGFVPKCDLGQGVGRTLRIAVFERSAGNAVSV